MPAVERRGLAGLTFHDLRRLNATAMVPDGVDLKTAQTRFGQVGPSVDSRDLCPSNHRGDQWQPMDWLIGSYRRNGTRRISPDSVARRSAHAGPDAKRRHFENGP